MTSRDQSGRTPGLILAALLSGSAFLAFPVAHAACATAVQETARAGEVLDAQTLRLEDGSEVRLIGVLPPQTPPWWKKPEPWPPAERARRALSELIASAGLELRAAEGEAQRDRHDRLMAHVFVLRGEERIWVQAHLISAGLARAASFSRHRACARDLQRLEDRARANRVGLWDRGRFATIPAANTEALSKRRLQFQIVEGDVRAVAVRPQWTFLNFGDDWRRDFTVAIAAKDRRRFRNSDVDLENLEGRTIRVRGWIESWNGPAIKVTHPEQIEVLARARQ